MSNEEVVGFVSDRMRVTDDLEKICNEVVDTCLHKGSRDNFSIIIIALPAAPKVEEEAKRKDEALDSLLQQRVTDIVKESSELVEQRSLTFSDVFERLQKENIPDLPTGGGLYTKKRLMFDVYDVLCPQKKDPLGMATESPPNDEITAS